MPRGHNKNLRKESTTKTRVKSVIPVVVRSDTTSLRSVRKDENPIFGESFRSGQVTPEPPLRPDREIESTRNQIATRLSRRAKLGIFGIHLRGR